MILRTCKFYTLAAVLLGSLATYPAAAQTWPRQTIKMVVTFPPGGSSDIVARVLSPLLAEKLGQSIIIDNRPGTGATIGAQIVVSKVCQRGHGRIYFLHKL